MTSSYDYAFERTKVLLGCYRIVGAADPVSYAEALAAVLSEFDERIVSEVTSPRTGYATRYDYAPNPGQL